VAANGSRLDPRAIGRAFAITLSGSLGMAGAGCDGSLEPIEVATGCPDRPLRGPLQWEDEPRENLIDDFEDGDLRLATASGRNGGWILGSDSSSGVLIAESSSRCAGRGGRAGHFSGSGFTSPSWGANWTAVFRNDGASTAQGYDGSRYGAISFWAAVGPDAEPPYEISVGLTTTDNAWNSGNCAVCMDYYRMVLRLAPTWQRHVVRFEVLAQAGYGDPLLDLRRDRLVGFILWPTHQFDVWIDDLRFEP
jgi:hypothetical protein